MAMEGGQEEWLYVTKQKAKTFLMLQSWEQQAWGARTPEHGSGKCKEPVSLGWCRSMDVREQDPESRCGEKAPEMDAVECSPGP